MKRLVRPLLAGSILPMLLGAASPGPAYDLIVRGGTIYDGSGGAPIVGDIAVTGDRIVKIAPHVDGTARAEIDARGKAVSPGFINMLAHPEVSLFEDGRALSDLSQGVTLEVLGEDSMGPLTPEMARDMAARQSDVHFPVTWQTLGQYMDTLERRGIAPNVASFVGAATVRTNLLGERDLQPDAQQLDAMRALVRQAMEEGAVGLTTALMYSPATYAKTPELIALAEVSAQCGGIFSAHIRNEGDRLLEAIDELVAVAKASGAPGHIYHFKQSGRDNWPKIDAAIARVEAARAAGVRITADMYTYPASATGLDAAMPPWVQDGGLEQWIARMRDPAVRAKVAAEMHEPHPAGWDNAYGQAGAGGTLLLAFKNPALKPLTGKTLAEVAAMRGKSPEETAIDLVIEDGTRVGVSYRSMTEDNLRREVALPWMMFDSDEAAPAPEGVFLLSNPHPRAYGSFARLLANYVRDEQRVPLAEAIRRLTSLPAATLSLEGRGTLAVGSYADIVVFDPATIADRATFAKPHALAVGVSDVVVNGGVAMRGGKATGAATGRFVHGRAWKGATSGGCRAKASDWTWAK
ncbi:MAG: D-aminoacylase [Sphingomonas sp.]|nr:D-aminoacylase [Sphingomonas sp.]